MLRLVEGYVDQYKLGTQREKGYIQGISSVYKDDSLNVSTITGNILQREIIRGVKV